MSRWLAGALLLVLAAAAQGLERKAVVDIDGDALTDETQVTSGDSVQNHLAIVWWIPHEFWQVALARDPGMSDADRQAVLGAFEGVSLLALVQADISPLGAFNFYTREQVASGLAVGYEDAGGASSPLTTVTRVKPDLELVLGYMKPMLTAAMGNLGNNMHFYVLEDTVDGGRLVDPYRDGSIAVTLTTRDGRGFDSTVEMPLDALFVPRTCPNGKPAHVSWRFCPWSGEPLPE